MKGNNICNNKSSVTALTDKQRPAMVFVSKLSAWHRLGKKRIILTHASSLIEWISYDKSQRQVTVQFANGSRYLYDGVPRLVIYGLITAESPGRFFNKRIKCRVQTWKMV